MLKKGTADQARRELGKDEAPEPKARRGSQAKGEVRAEGEVRAKSDQRGARQAQPAQPYLWEAEQTRPPQAR